MLTDEVLASNAFVFFIAGFETTSSTMSFLLLELAAHLDIQKRAREEIIEALDKHNHKVDYDIIKDLPYLEMVISGMNIFVSLEGSVAPLIIIQCRYLGLLPYFCYLIEYFCARVDSSNSSKQKIWVIRRGLREK